MTTTDIRTIDSNVRSTVLDFLANTGSKIAIQDMLDLFETYLAEVNCEMYDEEAAVDAAEDIFALYRGEIEL